ncbi:hypothetical protein BT63DRAFT_128327 [Microthyrium microscopicum]|uniref:Histidine-specific methyltransferase SAM-dependent domain-containing protein n=1 Tax=Microthyrium microscopicum TaxID=703497 RepID=A0A6A6TSV4_9PEZI|nr:hypothetical protein BT63DRAFT_128327 [Microthyrium microscopicum]
MMGDATSSVNSSRSTSPDAHIANDSWYCGSVFDIGGSLLKDTMREELNKKFLLTKSNGSKQRTIPASILHDEHGLRMWAEINRMPDYYQTRDEIALLEQNSKDLARHLKGAYTLIDLGCGDVRKVQPLLDTLDAMQVPVQYFALDLSKAVLVDCMRKLRPRYRHVQCFGLWGTFDDCLKWAKNVHSPKCYMSLGSMFGNDHFKEAVGRLKAWTDIMRPQDLMLLGLDGTQDRDAIWRSYHDEQGLFHNFIRNGMVHSNAVLGHEWFKPQDWDISGEFQDFPLMHRFVIQARRDVRCEPLGLSFRRGYKIVCYEGFKYEPAMMQKQFAAAGLKNLKQWKSPSGRIYQYLACRASLAAETLQ